MMEILRAQTSLEPKNIVSRLIRFSRVVRHTGEKPVRGVALAAIQQLYQLGLEKDAKIADLKREIDRLQFRLGRLEAAMRDKD